MGIINTVVKILNEKPELKTWYAENHGFEIEKSGDGWLRLKNGATVYESDASTFGSGAHGDTLSQIIADND